MTDNAKPWDGLPQHPERDGWHFLRLDGSEELIPCFWQVGAKSPWRRLLVGGFGSPDGIAGYKPIVRYHYHGPCLTPPEVTARVKDARREAFAECAALLQVYAAKNSTGWFERLIAAIRARGEGGSDV